MSDRFWKWFPWVYWLTFAVLIGGFIGLGIREGIKANEYRKQWLVDAKANGCKRTSYEGKYADVPIWTCPDGQVYREPR